jgi:phosphatidylglycerophosphatase A
VNIVRFLATLGLVGYAPAPGTCATLLTFGCIYGLYAYYACMLQGVYLIIVTIASGLIIHAVDRAGESDPSYIVLDEVVGACWVFWSVPPTCAYMIAGLLLFRFLDIVKPWPLYCLQQLPGAWGIVADDVAAGLLTNGIIWYCGSLQYM